MCSPREFTRLARQFLEAVEDAGDSPHSVVKLLRPVGGPDNNNALVPGGDAVELDQELGLQAAAGLVLARASGRENAVDLVDEDDGWLHRARYLEQHPHLPREEETASMTP